MTDQPNILGAAEVKLIKDRIDQSRALREQFLVDEKHTKNLRLYSGKHWNLSDSALDWNYYRGDDVRREDFIVANYVMPHVKIAFASIAAGDPDFYATPLNSAATSRARFTNALINTIFPQINAVRECERALRDSLIFGHGIVGVDWVTETRGMGLRTEHRRGETKDEVWRDDARVFRISPRVSYFDMRGEDPLLTDARYFYWQEFKPIIDLVKMGIHLSDEEIAGATPDYTEWVRENSGRSAAVEDKTRVEVYHYWDRDLMVYALCLKGRTRPLLSYEMPYHFSPSCLHPLPFEVITYSEVPDIVYAQSLPEQMEDEQLQLNLVMKRLAAYIRAAVPKYATNDPDMVTEENQAALLSEEFGAIIQKSREGTFDPLQLPNIAPEIWAYIRQLVENMAVKTGINEYLRSSSSHGDRTARESQLRAVLSGVRSNRDSSDYKKFLARVAKKVLCLYQQEDLGGKKREVLHIARDTGDKEFLQGNYRDCAGEWEIRVVAGSTEARDRDFEREMASLLLNVLTPLIPTGDVNVMPVLRKLLEAWGFIDIDDVVLDSEMKELFRLGRQMSSEERQTAIAVLSRAISRFRAAQKAPQAPQAPQGTVPVTVIPPVGGVGGQIPQETAAVERMAQQTLQSIP